MLGLIESLSVSLLRCSKGSEALFFDDLFLAIFAGTVNFFATLRADGAWSLESTFFARASSRDSLEVDFFITAMWI